jgi:TIR domain-containing protein
MPPEEPNGLVALSLELEDGNLTCRGVRVFPKSNQLKVSWYTAVSSPPDGYQPILDGVVFAYSDSIRQISKVDRFCPTRVGDHWDWRDQAAPQGLMIVLVLPPNHTLAAWDPPPIEAKKFITRVAAFWLLYPQTNPSVSVSWSLSSTTGSIDTTVENLNRGFSLARKRENATDYDVALSFAGEDREYVDQVADALRSAGVKVFYDKLEEADLWGKNLYTHLSDVYRKRARFTVMFISRSYAQKQWTNFEREAAQARAFVESREYILPARFDDTELPGMLPTTGYVSARERTPEQLADLILKKLETSGL